MKKRRLKQSVILTLIAFVFILTALNSVALAWHISSQPKVKAIKTSEILNNTEREVKYIGEYEITAYCPCEYCCGKTDGITATGTQATQGRTIAVDPYLIPYGTQVIIDGHTYIAEDCGEAIEGNKIDIFFDSHEEAEEYGVKNLSVYIVDNQNESED